MNDVAWISTRKGLLTVRREARGWRVVDIAFRADPVSAVLPARNGGPMLAALNLGHFGAKLHRSDDEGRSWRELPAPAFPPQPAEHADGAGPDSPDGPVGPDWKLGMIWTLEADAASERIWAGTLPGGLFFSDDRGETWTLNRRLWDRPERRAWMGGGFDVPGIHSIMLRADRPDDVMVGVSCGGVWASSDRGENWGLRTSGMRADFMPPEMAEDGNAQDPHRIVRSVSQPDVLWCQHHGGIWRSVDDGQRWESVVAPVSSFGFALAVHPHDPDTAWFVPAEKDERRIPVDGRMVVNRTRDGGRSFETSRDGLPQQDCFDLVHRHALAVDASGDRLLVGSTTGNLWASDDGGTRWELVSSHLPPIAAITF